MIFEEMETKELEKILETTAEELDTNSELGEEEQNEKYNTLCEVLNILLERPDMSKNLRKMFE